MYVNYYVMDGGYGISEESSRPSAVICGKDFFCPPKPSECVWMVPGTVDPLED